MDFSRILVLICCCLFSQLLTANSKTNTLTIFNWSGNVDPALVKAFEKQYSVKIHEIYFNANEDRDHYLVENGIEGIDICIVDNYKIDAYFKRDWLAKINPAKMPELKHIDPQLANNYSHLKDYAIPYMWGTMGLAYRSDLVKEPIKSWQQIFEPDSSLHGKIVMSSDSFELIGVALKAAGYSMNNISSEGLRKAKQLLEKQKQFIHEYGSTGSNEDVHLLSGDALVAQAYSGDALILQEKNSNIKYVIPEEGGTIWLDFLVVLKKSKYKKLAQDFINFLNKPEHAAQNSNFISFATANLAARQHLDNEFLQDPIIFPDSETMSRLELQSYPTPKILRQINMIYHQLMR